MRGSAALLALLVCAGCGTDERLPTSGSGPGSDAGADALPPDAGPFDAGPKIRSVERRNPFGNTATENNLMVDGDFEWTSGFGQHGWRGLGATGEVGVPRETGGLCHSGVTCGVLQSGVALLGMAAAPRNKKMLITLYTKPPEPDCGLTSISVISCTAAAVFTIATVPPTSNLPAASGWCQHRGEGPVISDQPCLYITTFSSGDARTLIDNVSIIAADGTGASPLAPTAPSAELAARVTRDVRWIHEHQALGRPTSRED